MPVITFQDTEYETGADESVLDTLLRHDVDIPYSCKAGVCNTCIMVSEAADLPANATKGLKDTLVARGHFLACQCVPTDHLVIRYADESGLFGKAVVIEKDFLSQDVCRMRLCSATDLYYRAGQYINIRMPIGQIRSYSLASLPAQDDYLEMHIKRMENGQVSNWLLDDVQIGDDLDFRGPYGDCFYLTENRCSDMLMIGTGTGLAPLLGILRDALHSGHRGEVYLYHGVRDVADLYLDDSLRELASRHKNVRYHACVSVLSEHCSDGVSAGRASEIALANVQLQKDMLVYLCGSPEMVNSTRKQAYLRGVDLKHIYADPFVTKDLRVGSAHAEQKVSVNDDRRKND